MSFNYTPRLLRIINKSLYCSNMSISCRNNSICLCPADTEMPATNGAGVFDNEALGHPILVPEELPFNLSGTTTGVVVASVISGKESPYDQIVTSASTTPSPS